MIISMDSRNIIPPAAKKNYILYNIWDSFRENSPTVKML